MITLANVCDQVSSSSSCCSVAHGQDMYTERLTPCQMFSRSEGRVAFVGTVLALVQAVGFIITLYLLVTIYTGTVQDDPADHVCVEAVLCLMFRYGPELHETGHTNTALAGQCVYSLVAITVNCILVCGALANNPRALVPWLVMYGLVSAGSLVLSVVIALTIIWRDEYLGDVELINVLWFVVPLAIFILYTVIWCFVFNVYRKFKSYKNDIYYIS